MDLRKVIQDIEKRQERLAQALGEPFKPWVKPTNWEQTDKELQAWIRYKEEEYGPLKRNAVARIHCETDQDF